MSSQTYPVQQEVRDKLSLLLKFTGTLHSRTGFDRFSSFALDSLLALVDAAAGSFFLWDDKSKNLVPSVVRSTDPSRILNTRIHLSDGVSGWVARQGIPTLVKDIGTDERFLGIERLGRYASLSFMSLPILLENKLLGVINVTEREDRLPFTEEEFQLALTYSEQIAVAYARLKAEQGLRDENDKLHQMVTDLRGSIKEQEVLVTAGKLAARVTHELGNPLDGIRRFLNLALDQVEEDSLAREYILRAKEGIRKSIQVVRGMLTFTRSTHRRGKPQRIDLHQIIDEVVRACVHDPAYAHMTIKKRFHPSPVLIDALGLNTVLHNIIQNTRQATAGSGTIQIETHVLSDNVVCLRMQDDGPGIPAEIQSRIFEPFFSTKPSGEGTGIGLTICKEIVERAGGRIMLENGAVRGVRFAITLPCYAAEAMTA